jgi:hypothetical protein
MQQVLKEKRILDFCRLNQESIDSSQKKILMLYNEIGRKYNDSSMQLGFLSIIILQLLKSSSAPKEETIKALENIKAKIN